MTRTCLQTACYRFLRPALPQTDHPDDFVRLEIEAALTRDVRVIPILVEAAQMPRATLDRTLTQSPGQLGSWVRNGAVP